MRNYISQCCSNANSIAITMVKDNTTHTLLPDEYNVKYITCPQNNLQKLLINVESLLATNKIAFIIYIFSSHGRFSFCLNEIQERKAPIHIYNYTDLQGLTYWHIAFSPIVSPIETRRVRHLRHLHLNHCGITDSCYTQLSSQFEHVDRFKTSYYTWREKTKKMAKKPKRFRFSCLTSLSSLSNQKLTIGHLTPSRSWQNQTALH